MIHKSKAIHTKSLLAAVFMVASVALCSCSYEDENGAENRTKQFAQDYFNLRFEQAASFCTDGSAKWIKYHASNIRQEDIDILDSQTDTATCEVDDFTSEGNSATAVIHVENFLCCDSIGRKSHICKNASFRVSLKRKNEVWLVHLDGPLEAENTEK